MPTVSCKQCGKEFHVKPYRLKSGRGKFCNRACYTTWQKIHWRNEGSPAWKGGISKVKRECEVCDSEFTTTKRLIDKGFGRFCGVKCASEWRSVAFSGSGGSNWQGGKKVARTCEICGVKYEAWHDRNKRFCSTMCMGKWQSIANLGENNPCWRGGRNKVERICVYCGEVFYTKQATIDKGDGRFCSRSCLAKSKTGENHPCWRGGTSPYPPEFDDDLKQQVREWDSHTCAICKLSGKDVHHVNYDKLDNNLANLITLCRPCHAATNFNRPYWQPVLTSLIHARYQPLFLM